MKWTDLFSDAVDQTEYQHLIVCSRHSFGNNTRLLNDPRDGVEVNIRCKCEEDSIRDP